MRDLLNSAWFRGKSSTYQGMMRRHAEDTAQKYGPGKLRGLTAKYIEMDLNKLDPNPANDRLKVWRALLTHAKVDPNSALAVKRRAVRVIGVVA